MTWKSLAIGGAIGYVLGALAGRGRYEQIATISSKTWNSKPVRMAKDKAKGAAGNAAHGLKARAQAAAPFGAGQDDQYDTGADGTVKETAVEI